MAQNPSPDDVQAAAIFRDIETRVVWVGAFLVNRACRGMTTAKSAEEASKGLDEYQQRFPAIKP